VISKLPTLRHPLESAVAFERAHLRRQEAEADRATAVTVVDAVDERREFLTPAMIGREQIRLMLAGRNKVEQQRSRRTMVYNRARAAKAVRAGPA